MYAARDIDKIKTYKSVYTTDAVEHDDCFEETLGNLSETLERSMRKALGQLPRMHSWTFGVAPTHFHPRTRILKAAYRVRRQSFVAIKRAVKRDARRREGRKMEHACASEKASGIVQSFRLRRRMRSTIASVGRIIGASYRRSEKIQRTRFLSPYLSFFFFAITRDIADAIKCRNRLLSKIGARNLLTLHTLPRVKRRTKVTIYQPSNIVDNSRLKRLTHKSSLILSTACQHKRQHFSRAHKPLARIEWRQQ